MYQCVSDSSSEENSWKSNKVKHFRVLSCFLQHPKERDWEILRLRCFLLVLVVFETEIIFVSCRVLVLTLTTLRIYASVPTYATGTTIITTLDNGIHIGNSSFLPLNLYFFEKLFRVWRKTNPSTLSSIMDLQDNFLVFPIQAKPNQNSLPSLTFGSKDTAAIKLCMMIFICMFVLLLTCVFNSFTSLTHTAA